MAYKNNFEKEKLYQWACDNDDFREVLKDKNVDSYFEIKDHENYLREYKIENAKDVRLLVEELCNTNRRYEDIKKVITVAALKNRVEQNNREVGNDEYQEALPTFIYNF